MFFKSNPDFPFCLSYITFVTTFASYFIRAPCIGLLEFANSGPYNDYKCSADDDNREKLAIDHCLSRYPHSSRSDRPCTRVVSLKIVVSEGSGGLLLGVKPAVSYRFFRQESLKLTFRRVYRVGRLKRIILRWFVRYVFIASLKRFGAATVFSNVRVTSMRFSTATAGWYGRRSPICRCVYVSHRPATRDGRVVESVLGQRAGRRMQQNVFFDGPTGTENGHTGRQHDLRGFDARRRGRLFGTFDVRLSRARIHVVIAFFRVSAAVRCR